MVPCAMDMELGVQQTLTEERYVQPAWAVSMCCTCTARSGSICAGFQAVNTEAKQPVSLPPGQKVLSWRKGTHLRKSGLC